jgi:hypothetical protein
MNSIPDVGAAGPKPDTTDRWELVGELKGSATFDQRCANCGRNDLRVIFEVHQTPAVPTSGICQHCLSKAPVPVEQAGRTMQGRELRDHLNELAVRVMVRTCRDVLRDLLARKNDNDLREVAVYFDRNAQLSPRRAATLFLALSNARLDVDPRIFEVQTRSTEHRQEYGRLGELEKLVVWPVLSPVVRRRLIALGLAPDRYAMSQGRRTRTISGQQNAALSG